ncbi:unnamed protein product [Miscanthus lutarioriparius]|uniref:F-box domain-containing protein n=1 Tax=Miscanthus lutarioriparius TaxID=422564 RepID=A0A811NR97_9POAL|nr:unnamed protein product [Miscanthus lutarioriparius]
MAPPRQGEEQDVGGDSAAALRAPAHVMARVFSQLDCVDLLSCSLVCNLFDATGVGILILWQPPRINNQSWIIS